MDRIAFIYGETFIYWSSVIITLGALTAVCMFLAVYLGKSRNGIGAAVMVPLSIILSLVIGRLIHWYSRADSYDSFQAAMTNFSSGEFALMGAFLGCLVAALLLRLLRIVKNLPKLTDAMMLGGLAGIAVGRLAPIFSTADRGMLIEGITSLPLVYPIENAVSGEVEYRLATFMLQSIAAAAIFAVFMVFYLVGKKWFRLKDGDAGLLALVVYSATQVVLDSTRYDSLFMRSNGFISLVQILSAVGIVLPTVYFSVRMVKAMKWRWWFIGLWLAFVGTLAGAGYMEYHVQRHGNEAVFAYSVMSACLIGAVILVSLIRLIAVIGEKRTKAAPNNA